MVKRIPITTDMRQTLWCQDVLRRVVAFYGWHRAHRVLGRVCRGWRAAVAAVVVHPVRDGDLVDAALDLLQHPRSGHWWWLVLDAHPGEADVDAAKAALLHAPALACLVLDGWRRGRWQGPPALVARGMSPALGAALGAALGGADGPSHLTDVELHLEGPKHPEKVEVPAVLHALWLHAPALRRLAVTIHGPCKGSAGWMWRLARDRLHTLRVRCADVAASRVALDAGVDPSPRVRRPTRFPLRRLDWRGGGGRRRTDLTNLQWFLLRCDLLAGLEHLGLDLDGAMDLSCIDDQWLFPAVRDGAPRRRRSLELALAHTGVSPKGIAVLLSHLGPADHVRVGCDAPDPHTLARRISATCAAWDPPPSCCILSVDTATGPEATMGN